MDIHGAAAAAAFTENEPPDREHGGVGGGEGSATEKRWPASYETTWPRVSVGDQRAVVSALSPEGHHAQRRDFQGLT